MTRRGKQPLHPKIAALIKDFSPEAINEISQEWAKLVEATRKKGIRLEKNYHPPEPLYGELQKMAKKMGVRKREVM